MDYNLSTGIQKYQEKEHTGMDIIKLWYDGSESDWKSALDEYNEMPSVKRNKEKEERMRNLDPESVRKMSVQEFYRFLYNDYFVWKYTANNRLATTRKHLKRYEAEGMSPLKKIQQDIFDAFSNNPNDTKELFNITIQIHGLGTAGVSGLLAVLFPEYYGTIDQFVVYALRKLNLPEQSVLEKMNPEGLTERNAVDLETILRRKANELNKKFNSTFWTPKRIDMVLWTYREKLTAYNNIASAIEKYGAALTEEERNELSEKILECKQ